MILKTSIWIESKNFSQPEVEKEVIQDNLRKFISDLLKLRSKDLDNIGMIEHYAGKSLITLISNLKELEAQTISHKRVLEVMRTGLNNPE